MDIGPATSASPPRPAVPPPAADAAGTDAPSRTELPARKTVSASGPSVGTSDRDAKPSDRATERRLTIDPETRAIVQRTIDSRTSEIVSQSPDQALLRLRAYFDRISDRASAPDAAEGGVVT